LFAKVIDTERWKNAVRISHIDELCQTYGDQTVGMNGSKLSGGEKKRVLLARAVYKNAPLYIFDELTSSLDSTLARSILEELIQYLQGRTILFIDHSEIVK
ncbi:ATP-binding cassette domain-containing protein, partial [Bacillus licheniformis]